MAAAACGDGSGPAEGEGLAPVSVQDTAGVPSAFLAYGVEQGRFRDNELDVKVTPSQGGATVVPAVVSGDTDIAGSNLVSVLLAQGKDIPVKIIAPGTFVRGERSQDFSAIIAAGDGDIRSSQDLEGKTLAVNTLENVAELTAKASLSKQGVDVSEIELTEVDFPDMNAALSEGRVDAAFQIEPFVSLALEEGHRVVDRPYVGTKPGLQIGCYFTSEQYLSENGDVVERFQQGVADTAAAIAEDPAAFRMVVLGLVTTKRGALESKDELKRRLEEASRFVDVDQLCLSPQCGFSSTVEGNVLSYEQEVEKLRLIVETAEEVWG